MALQFFPRGGSAHVARSLATALPRAGWDVRVLSGSIAGGQGDARAFYRGLDVHAVDMTAALDAPDPLRADLPLHPSFEDKPGAPDRIFTSVDAATLEHQVAAWADALEAAGAADADVLHLHHLTPINEAAARVAPDVPVIGHLHGTELLMLEGTDDERWRARLRAWAQACERLVVLSPSQVARAEALLGVDPARCVLVPNGFDPERFTPAPITHDDTVALYVGRFTAVKRVPLLIEAFHRARPRFAGPARLVLVGGFPGEHEGEHPADTIARLGASDVELAGWHDHDALPGLLNAADVVVLPSVREQFGQVLVEGMACGLPAIAVDAYGPADIVRDGETGWLVPPDDGGALLDALVAAVNHPLERARRGARARADVLERFAWPALADRIAAVYEAVADHRYDFASASVPMPPRSTPWFAARGRPSRLASTTQPTSTTPAASRSSRG